VDLVLGGHSHSYERSYLLKGHFGTSATLVPSMKVNDGDGREDGLGPYRKPVAGPGAGEGTVYIVAGSSGKLSGGWLNHPAMYLSANRLGSMVLDIAGPRLDARFLRETGEVGDYFTILKGDQPLRVSTFQLAGSSVTLRWLSQAGRSYRVERSPSLVPAAWTPVSGVLPGTGLLMTWTSPGDGPAAGAYFRVQQLAD
jgi:hypothetical protein